MSEPIHSRCSQSQHPGASRSWKKSSLPPHFILLLKKQRNEEVTRELQELALAHPIHSPHCGVGGVEGGGRVRGGGEELSKSEPQNPALKWESTLGCSITFLCSITESMDREHGSKRNWEGMRGS